MPRSPPPRADTNQKTRTRKDGENNPPEDQCPLEDSQKLHSAVATYNPFSLPPLSRPASPLSENLRRYEKYGLERSKQAAVFELQIVPKSCPTRAGRSKAATSRAMSSSSRPKNGMT